MPASSDLVHQTTQSTGNGNLTLAAAFGKRTFGDAFGTGAGTNVFDYFIASRVAAEWERGTGHMSDATTLVRDTPIKGSAGDGTRVTFGAGTKDVTNDIPSVAAARLDLENQQGVGGIEVVSKDLGTPGAGTTVTLDMADRPMQHLTNNAAFTLSPGTPFGACFLDILNGASAGVITLTGWTRKVGDNLLTQTSGHKFRAHCSVGQQGSLIVFQPLQ